MDVKSVPFAPTLNSFIRTYGPEKPLRLEILFHLFLFNATMTSGLIAQVSWLGLSVGIHLISGVTRRGRGGRTAPSDTLQGVTPEGKNCFVGKFTKNSGETRSDR